MKSQSLPIHVDLILLNNWFVEVLKEQEGEPFYALIQQVLSLAEKSACSAGRQRAVLLQFLEKLPLYTIQLLTKSLLHFLDFANCIEQNQLSKLRQDHLESEFKTLLKSQDANSIFNALKHIQVELVLTAHPTEIKRQSVMRHLGEISENITKLKNKKQFEKELIIAKIKESMVSLWQTNPLRDQKPSPIQEVYWGLYLARKSLWNALPDFLSLLELKTQKHLGKQFPLDYLPIRFGSWIGGDRDGNPNINANVTQKAIMLSCFEVTQAYVESVKHLKKMLSMSQADCSIIQLVGHSNVPYRVFLNTVLERLKRTQNWLAHCLEKNRWLACPKNSYQNHEAFLADIMLCYHALCAKKASRVAQGSLLALIRRIHCFGFSFMKLDIRESAKAHRDFILQFRLFKEEKNLTLFELLQKILTENVQKYSLGQNELKSVLKNPQKKQFWENFKILSLQPRWALNHYIISQTSQPEDILIVLYLQQQAKLKTLLPVVPLLETEFALKGGVLLLEKLFEIPWYLQHIAYEQEVMIGYSDSAKDAGFMNACWRQYVAEKQILALGRKYGVKIRFFHGRGGSISRGGSASEYAIEALPGGSLKEGLRLTQQGEVIYKRFANSKLAMGTLFNYTQATLLGMLTPETLPEKKWIQIMEKLSGSSKEVYQNLVYHTPNFYDFFQQFTPIKLIGKLLISSRPNFRHEKDSPKNIFSIRAIPWIFAWNQVRFLLPVWFGIGTSLKTLGADKKHLKIMYQKWPFFQNMIHLLGRVFSKVDLDTAKCYQHHLLSKKQCTFAKKLNKEFLDSEKMILSLLKTKSLLGDEKILTEATTAREPYLVVLNMIQIILLKQLKDKVEQTQEIEQALLLTVMGIAAGVRNTG